jgi:hypothetical protein
MKFKVTVTGRKGKAPSSFTTFVEATDIKAAQRHLEAAMFLPRFEIQEEKPRQTLRASNAD